MELIVSHNTTDFDGLASMVAASKLYPSALMVLESKPTRQVREFLALHKDALPILDIKSVDLQKVTKIIVVDTCSSSRLGSLAKLVSSQQVEVHVYDHHPKSPNRIISQYELITTIGATTTLLVELIEAQKLAISPFEATVLALGIYEDTGSLLFEGTTVRDVRVVAYLLECGANLELISQFMERPLSTEQKSLLNLLLTSTRHYVIKNTRVVITTATTEEFIAGLALLTHKLSEIENPDVIFVVVKMDDRVHIVARSKGKSLAVNEVLQEFGGAGHPKAASATLKNAELESIIPKLLKLLNEKVLPEVTAREIMSTHVKSVPSTTTMEEARDILLHYGHTGIPVLEGCKLVGIISRRDIDKALNHRLGHSPVTGYMSRQVVCIEPSTSISEIQELMISHDIGRLPVLKDGILVGIISRSDVLRTLHGQAVPVSQQILNQRSVAQGQQVMNRMEELPLEVRDLFRLIQQLAKGQGFRVYVVGGFVRDLILNVPNLDVDLVVEGDAPEFARLLAEQLSAKLQIHPQFGTATVSAPNGMDIDVVTARMEYYDYPAALPTVEISSLKQDLFRRDFTINAMAVELDAEYFGILKDFYGGYRDLQQGLIRLLHNLSLVDDPTRILRAIRFETRFDFRLEEQTLALIHKAIQEKLLHKLSRERIKNELVLILKEAKSGQILERLADIGAAEQVVPGINLSKITAKFLQIEASQGFLAELGLWQESSIWQIKLLLLLQDSPLETALQIVQDLKFDRRTLNLTQQFLTTKTALTGIYSLEGELKKGILHSMLEKAPKEVVAALLSQPQLQAGIKDYLMAWGSAEVLLNGKDLVAMGIPPGPLFTKLLSALWDARLEGLVNSKEQEQALVMSLVKEAENVNN
jgi:tRNA nucleotidyltransferase (CCA-adding enzyme)